MFDAWFLFEKPAEYVPELNIEDANETNDWQVDYRRFSKQERIMQEQLNILRQEDLKQTVELKHSLEALSAGQRHAYDIVAAHVKKSQEKQL